jgi:hypothetical protein
VTLLGLVIVIAAGVCEAQPGEVDIVAAVNAEAAALDHAFERQDAEAIKALTTPDHVAVTPYYGAPQTVAEQTTSLPDLKYAQTNIGAVAVTLLGSDAAMRGFTADLDGTFMGKPIPKRVFVNSIMVRQDGQWRERFYQVTAMKP